MAKKNDTKKQGSFCAFMNKKSVFTSGFIRNSDMLTDFYFITFYFPSLSYPTFTLVRITVHMREMKKKLVIGLPKSYAYTRLQ